MKFTRNDILVIVGAYLSLLLLLPLTLLPTSHAQEALPADCLAYLDARQADVEILRDVFDAGNTTEIHRTLFMTRHRYEDMEDVPECATDLHALFIKLISANGDVIGLVIPVMNEDEQALADSEVVGARIARFQSEIAAELERIGYSPED